ncbi:MAG: insulinase family protein [candidate division KSB1 bacterium]|nr:insulinase family protein [candidate division KSB1 bacterium]MDZ7302067.1 insulinase family protein [candidate division KSB1 bacterium]MDZ7311109.1 insulinase family protein [candidate division KSB1 bacterium]
MQKHILIKMVLLLIFAASLAPAQEIDRAKKPEAGPEPQLVIPIPQKVVLSNGLALWLVEHHELPMVQMRMIIKSGSTEDPAGKAGVASFTAAMLDEGTKTRDLFAIEDDLDFIGANLNTGSSWDGSFITLTTLVKHLDKALEIFADVILNPVFPPKEFERLKDQRLTSLLQEKDQPVVLANKAFARVLYGETHPYGQPEEGSENSVKTITREDLVNFYRHYYVPNNATLLVVGDLTLKDLQPRITKAFMTWKKKITKRPSLTAPGKSTGVRIFLVDKPEAAQSEIRVGQIGVARDTKDYFPLTVLNTILGGQFSSRLNLNLRENKGYTYGARSSFSMRRLAGPFTAQAGVKTAVTDSALIEFMKEIRNLSEQPVSLEELTFAQSTLTRSLPRQLETPGQLISQMSEAVLYNLPDNFLNTMIPNIQAVTVEDVQRVARTCLNPKNLTVVIAGDVAKIRDGLQKLGYGPVAVYDLDTGTIR